MTYNQLLKFQSMHFLTHLNSNKRKRLTFCNAWKLSSPFLKWPMNQFTAFSGVEISLKEYPLDHSHQWSLTHVQNVDRMLAGILKPRFDALFYSLFTCLGNLEGSSTVRNCNNSLFPFSQLLQSQSRTKWVPVSCKGQSTELKHLWDK